MATGRICQLGGRVNRSSVGITAPASTPHHAPSGMDDQDKKDNGQYVGEIKGGMRPSMKLVVMGIIDKKPKSIEVTVSCKPQEEEAEADVGLQLKVSFMDKAVQRNARLAGKWGPCENTLSFFPFAPGEAFKRNDQIHSLDFAHSAFKPAV
ncbi:galectin-related protein B isoform X2 [Xiphophorus hellerii]|uniref:galectin-related protein B isoform X2 n=1 Tax=Xiphophorus hellerii TaxID=8084 RepID=UPI0013B42ABD|nr:galectin-related protein B-like isoform X2 [Xiphophorus hellerii]